MGAEQKIPKLWEEVEKNKSDILSLNLKTPYDSNIGNKGDVVSFTKLCKMKTNIGSGCSQYTAVISGGTSFGQVSSTTFISASTRNADSRPNKVVINLTTLGPTHSNGSIIVTDNLDGHITLWLRCDGFQGPTSVQVINSNQYSNVECYQEQATITEPPNIIGDPVSLLGNEVLTMGNCLISRAENGWCKFLNGLIVQWGTTISGATMKKEVFPIAFSNATSFSLSVTPQFEGALENSDVLTSSRSTFTGNMNNTAFIFGMTTLSPISVSQSKVKWLAVGY